MTSSCYEQSRDWKSLNINDNAYMICLRTENKLWKILLTNLIEIWIETLTDETMFRKCQTLNPLLTLEAFDWQELIMDMLNNIPKHLHKYNAEAFTYRLELQKEKDFIKLKFALDLVKGTSQQLWDNVTMSFCLSSMELIRQHDILLDLIKRKDEEIAEYKAEGAELIRKYIATKPFSKELFHVNAGASDAIDFIKAFQSIFQFYNTMNLSSSRMNTELEISSNGVSNISKVDGSILSESSKSETVRPLRQNDLNEQACSKIEKCEDVSSANEASILKLSDTFYQIQKYKKNKKTLSNFVL